MMNGDVAGSGASVPYSEDHASTSGSESEGNDEVDDGSMAVLSKCLFCPWTSVNPDQVINEHMPSAHGVNFPNWQKKYGLDQLKYIRFVNYCRKSEITGLDAKNFMAVFETQYSRILQDDRYLAPVIQDDGLLCYFVPECDDDLNGTVSVLMEDLKLQHSSEMECLQGCVATMKSTMNRILYDESGGPEPQGTLKPNEDWYFDSYDDLDIHAEMLNDKERTEAYMYSILNNKDEFKGKIVVDVGCGTGILSMFAAKAGANLVLAVDNSTIILDAIEVVRENNFQDKIKCISGKVEDNYTLQTYAKKIDILISEWMGYFLLQEGMLKSVLFARDNYLKKGGLMFPNAAAMYIVAADNPKGHHENVGIWDDVYGFKMTALKNKAKRIAVVDVVKQHEIVTDPVAILVLDLTTCSMEDTIIDKQFSLVANRDCHITSIVGYFDVGFTMCSNYSHILRTGPGSIPTHWSQTSFHLERTIFARKGDVIPCRLKCTPNRESSGRQMDIVVEVQGRSQYYEIK